MINEQKAWDVIVVGGGAAGFTAGLYAARRALATLVIAKDVGGQALLTQHIENYPGFIEPISGPELLAKFWQQAEKHGAKTAMDEVVKISAKGGPAIMPLALGGENDEFIVHTKKGETLTAKSVILAFGMTPKDMGVPGEQEFSGKGVHYCATCDAPLYKGKITAVVGGTNAAMDAALFLAKICPKVYLVHNRAKLVGDANLVAQIAASSVIQFLSERIVKEVKGEKFVTTLVVQGNSSTSSENTIAVDGVFVEMGHIIKTECVKGLIELDQMNAIVTDRQMHTSCPGVFSCGDVTDLDYKQVVISAGQGAIAALEAYKYLQLKSFIVKIPFFLRLSVILSHVRKFVARAQDVILYVRRAYRRQSGVRTLNNAHESDASAPFLEAHECAYSAATPQYVQRV